MKYLTEYVVEGTISIHSNNIKKETDWVKRNLSVDLGIEIVRYLMENSNRNIIVNIQESVRSFPLLEINTVRLIATFKEDI